MFQKVDHAADYIGQEHRMLEFWKDKQIFEKLVKQNEGNPRWSFLDGPITANNPMGVHHAWGRTYKDCFQRYYAMKGYQQRYQNGFDCQGLWIEVEVEKELDFKTKRDIESYGLENFVTKCKERASKYARIQTDESIRLGYWMDWNDSYYTMTDENNYTIWTFLKKCHQRGFIYKGADSMPWCPRCGTGISQHEMHEGYKEVKDLSVFLRLPIRGRDREYLLVWTTTPWTLSANVACAVHNDILYSVVRQGDGTYYIASALVDIMKEKGPFEVVREIPGREMIGWKYVGPFDEFPAQSDVRDEHRVVGWELVSDDEGTGIVHIAPGCGKEDFDLSGIEELQVLAPIDENGVFIDGYGFLTGLPASEIAEDVLKSLREKEYYYKKEDYLHNYPHCWRCGTALLFRNVSEWFINMSWRNEIKEVARQIQWIPDWGLARELDWLDNMRDWMISKKRFWGLALPIYECECGWFDVIGSKQELKERAIEGWDEFDGHSPHRPWVDGVKIKCEKCGKTVPRIKDVGNPWLDAGIVPYSTVRYNTDREYWKEWIPADLVLECLPGQFRNWFYALLAMSTMMENVPPFKTLFGHALVRDEKGEEMHKSTGNAIWFTEAAEKMGVDVMRWAFCRQTPTANLNFGYTLGKQIERTVFNTWWNVYAFFCNYARLDRFDPGTEPVPISQRTDMDRWILSNLNLLVELVDREMPNYNMVAVMRAAEEFIERLSNWYVRRNRRRFWRTQSDEDIDKLAAYQTLYEVLTKLCRVMAPVVPFVTEAMYLNLVRSHDASSPESVHMCTFPEADESIIDRQLSEDMDAAADLVSRVLGLRKERQVRVRQPLASVTVGCRDKSTADAFRRFENHILDELNVKELVLVDDLSDMISYSVKPNFSVTGPKFGKAVPEIGKALSSMDAAQVARRVKAGLDVAVTVDGRNYDLAAEDIIVETVCPEHIALYESTDYTTALDTSLTDELMAEGMVRDLVRHIQTLRKDRGFELDDRINLHYSTESDTLSGAIDNWLDYVKSETLALDASSAISGDPDKVIEITGHKVALKLDKVP
ncbi:MAG: isoleucine--tRNA ligase [Candidatus Zixiibacteriota bacterium]|nr:MAG: isoleucine--tRNA ligase [candidate division Zixibacteria bacterium]